MSQTLSPHSQLCLGEFNIEWNHLQVEKGENNLAKMTLYTVHVFVNDVRFDDKELS